jgi:hypothetical protein
MVEMTEIHQVMWFVMLESAKDQILGVETSGQHVSPHLWYGTSYLLIRTAIDCESCSAVWGKTQDVIRSTRYRRGSRYEETLALQARPEVRENHSKA